MAEARGFHGVEEGSAKKATQHNTKDQGNSAGFAPEGAGQQDEDSAKKLEAQPQAEAKAKAKANSKVKCARAAGRGSTNKLPPSSGD